MNVNKLLFCFRFLKNHISMFQYQCIMDDGPNLVGVMTDLKPQSTTIMIFFLIRLFCIFVIRVVDRAILELGNFAIMQV